jgi:hypothetical protein
MHIANLTLRASDRIRLAEPVVLHVAGIGLACASESASPADGEAAPPVRSAAKGSNRRPN